VKAMENRLKLLSIMENDNHMLDEDRAKLMEIMSHYSVKEFMKVVAEVSLEIAGDLSDRNEGHSPPIAKEFTQLSATLEDLAEGRPFLV